MFVVVIFAIANREPVSLDLWPFELSLPLHLVLLACIGIGLLIGSLATWLSAGRMRRRGRRARHRVEELEREVARLRQERDRAARTGTTGSGQAGLPAPATPTADAAAAPAPGNRSALGR